MILYTPENFYFFPSRSRKREHTPYFPFSQIPEKELLNI